MTLLAPHVPALLLGAILVDAVVGDPDWLWRRAPHPVVLCGRLIGWLDRWLNGGEGQAWGRTAGIAALAIIIGVAWGIGEVLAALFALHPLGLAGEIIVVAILLAQRSLYDHVRRVFDAFAKGGLPAARIAVSQIVGRDPEALDESGVCRAAIETTAENFSDGVVAPAFWYLVAGLPGILIYKAINTADSMIGHRSPRYKAFGWAAARLDDVVNLIPARLSGLMVVAAAFLTGADARGAWTAMLRDARSHRSPNAGWPEAATAGALGVAIAGPRRYPTGWVEDGWMNTDGRKELQPADIGRNLRLFIAGCAVQAALVAMLALAAL